MPDNNGSSITHIFPRPKLNVCQNSRVFKYKHGPHGFGVAYWISDVNNQSIFRVCFMTVNHNRITDLAIFTL